MEENELVKINSISFQWCDDPAVSAISLSPESEGDEIFPDSAAYILYRINREVKVKLDYTPSKIGNKQVLVFGFINDKKVITPSAEPGLFHFTIFHKREDGVGAENIQIHWFYTINNKNKKHIMTTNHRFYYLLDLPSPPWTPFNTNLTSFLPASEPQLCSSLTKEGGDDKTQLLSLPWISVLEIVCDWARSATKENEVISKISNKIRSFGDSASFYYILKPKFVNNISNAFLCTKFLEKFNNIINRRIQLNCQDLSTLLVSFCNIIGCKLKIVKMFSKKNDAFLFCRHKIMTLGTQSQKFCERRNDLKCSIHEVAWDGALYLGRKPNPDAKVWDLALALKKNNQPVPLLDIPFYSENTINFLNLLYPVTADDLKICEIKRSIR